MNRSRASAISSRAPPGIQPAARLGVAVEDRGPCRPRRSGRSRHATGVAAPRPRGTRSSRGSLTGTHDDLVVSPFSSLMQNTPIGRTGTRQPGKVGSDRQTSTSSSSPSSGLGVRDESIVGRIDHGCGDEPVELDRSQLRVVLIFVAASHWDLHHAHHGVVVHSTQCLVAVPPGAPGTRRRRAARDRLRAPDTERAGLSPLVAVIALPLTTYEPQDLLVSCLAGITLPASRGRPSRERYAEFYRVLARSRGGSGGRRGQRLAGQHGDRAQVGVEVAAQGVAQDRPQVSGQLVDQRVGRRDRRRRRQPGDTARSNAIACAVRSASRERSSGRAQMTARRWARRPLAGPSGSSSARRASR